MNLEVSVRLLGPLPFLLDVHHVIDTYPFNDKNEAGNFCWMVPLKKGFYFYQC